MGLYQRLRDLFRHRAAVGARRPDAGLYVEGHGPAMARHGHSRDGKPRNVQVVVGVVMVAGWPITHHVWAGNTRDVTTVPEVLLDLAQRFDFRLVRRSLATAAWSARRTLGCSGAKRQERKRLGL